MSKSFIKASPLLRKPHSRYRLETGFSMLEAVVVVGVLLALAVGGFFAYGPITENAKRAKVKSAASEIHTGVLVASIDGDSATDPQDVIDAWNASTNKIRVEILEPASGGASANGDFCVQATNLESTYITAREGACDDATEATNPDIDGDGLPNGSDPDIDGDGIPNETDTTPNGETTTPGGGEVIPPPATAKCADLSANDEVVCWMDIATVEQEKSAAETGSYFGNGYYDGRIDRPYTGTAFDGIPLLHGFRQDHAEYDGADAEWNYIEASVTMASRDGVVWKQVFYNEYNQIDGNYTDPAEPTGQNTNYDCKYVTPSQMLPVCEHLGMNINMYSDIKTDNDATADADVRKVLEAQLAYIRTNRAPYGGYNTTVDVQAFAGTTYGAKVFNTLISGDHMVRVMIVGANGDLYTAQARISNLAKPIDYPGVARTFRYSADHVASVCGRPYIGATFQSEDVKTCSTLGYPNFKP